MYNWQTDCVNNMLFVAHRQLSVDIKVIHIKLPFLHTVFNVLL